MFCRFVSRAKRAALLSTEHDNPAFYASPFVG